MKHLTIYVVSLATVIITVLAGYLWLRVRLLRGVPVFAPSADGLRVTIKTEQTTLTLWCGNKMIRLGERGPGEYVVPWSQLSDSAETRPAALTCEYRSRTSNGTAYVMIRREAR
jgi:hypothetical protein